MPRFTTAIPKALISLHLAALTLGFGLISTARAQDSSADPLQRNDNAAVGGSSENILNSPFDLFHEAVLSGGTSREQYREDSTEQINEATADFRQENGYGQQPFRLEFETVPAEAVSTEDSE